MSDNISIQENNGSDIDCSSTHESDVADKKQAEPRNRNVIFTATHGRSVAGKCQGGACSRNVICTAARSPDAANNHNKSAITADYRTASPPHIAEAMRQPEATSDKKAPAPPPPEVLAAREDLTACSETNPHNFKERQKVAQDCCKDKGPASHSPNTSAKKKECRNISRECKEEGCPDEGLYGRGLLYYSNWWYRDKVELIVNGKPVDGIPIFIDQNTLRVVNEKYSYFIPIEKIDYIRTTDGLV